jgi:hypothetical protein
MSTARRKRSSSIDDQVEAKRRIIRRTLSEIIVAVEQAMQRENLRSRIHIVVPSRHSLITIAGPCDSSPEEWARLSSIVSEVVGQKLGREGLRGRPLARATATAKLIAADLTPDP